MMLGLAHDFTNDSKYLNGVAMGMDYLMGRNPLDQSYVTGWGDRPLENPYHRFWCNQANPKYPVPPPGILSGGPNSGFEDPYMASAGLARLRAAEVLPRQRRGLVRQRGDDQLERAAVLGDRVPRREARPQVRRQSQEEVVSRPRGEL